MAEVSSLQRTAGTPSAWLEPEATPGPVPAQPEETTLVEPHEGGWRPEAGTPWAPAEQAAELRARAEAEAQRQRDGEALHGAMAPALKALARHDPDPVGVLGQPTIRCSENPAFPGWTRAMRSEALGELARRLPRGEVQGYLRQEVSVAWRGRPADDLERITGFLAGQVGTMLRDHAAVAMRDQAAAMMRDTANSLEAVARGPGRSAELAGAVQALSTGTPAQQALAARLGRGLGLEDLQDPSGLTARLQARAALLRREAQDLAETDVHRKPRALAEHDVGQATMEAAGIAPGSWAATGLRAAVRESQTDRERVEATERLAGFVAVGAIALLGPAGLPGLALGAGVDLGLGGLGVALADREVDRALAGELAGTRRAGATEEARLAVRLKEATLAVSMVATPGLGKPLASLAEPAAAEAVGAPVVHAAAELLVHGAVEAGGEASRKALARPAPGTASETESP